MKNISYKLYKMVIYILLITGWKKQLMVCIKISIYFNIYIEKVSFVPVASSDPNVSYVLWQRENHIILYNLQIGCLEAEAE